MATSKTKAAPPAPELDVEAEATRPETVADDLSAMMADLAAAPSANVTVYRIVKNMKPKYICKCTPDSFSLDDLRDKYKGGEFRLFITKNGVMHKNIEISVEPPEQEPAEKAPAESAELVRLREELATQAAKVRMLETRPVEGGGLSLAGLDIPAVITAVAAAVTALRPPPPPPLPPPPDPNQGIDLLLKGIELARELRSDGGGEEPSLMGMLRDVIKSPMLAQAVTATVAQHRTQTQLPAPHPKHPPPQTQATQPPAPHPTPAPQSFASENATQPNPIMQAGQYLAFLVAKAEAGSDPLLYADLVLDNVDDTVLEMVFAGQPTPVDYLATFHAPVAQHREWFDSLLTQVKEALMADDANPAAQPMAGD